MKLTIEQVSIDTIKPFTQSVKEHTQEQIKKIAKSIEEFGNCDPIGIWHNEIVEGHGRYLALKQLGVSEIPVIKLDHLTDQQKRAYSLIHNKLTLETGFDLALLEQELEKISDIDMSEFSFEKELADLESIDDINSKLEQFDHVLKIDRTKIIMTEDEFTGIMQRFNDYVSINGVAFGFVRSLLNG